MTLPRIIKAALRLFRPDLSLAAGLCVVVGEILALDTFPPLRLLVLGFACGFFLSGSALITNDYFDLEVDRINAPQRPLPSGIISPQAAMALGLAAGLIGLAAAGVCSPLAFWFSLPIWGLGFWYNWKLKTAGLWGNLAVSTSVGATFVLGGMMVGEVWNATVWTFGLIAFTFDLAEEIAGDAMDAEGDKKRGSQSIALLYGRQVALRISGLLFGLVVLLSFLPIVWGKWSLQYLVTISIMDSSIAYFVRKLLQSQTPAEGRRAMRGLYISASIGLLAFLL